MINSFNKYITHGGMMTAKQLKDRVAIITGAAGGIGTEIAKLLDREGVKLVLADINTRGLEDLKNSLSGNPLIVTCDITDRADVKNLISSGIENFGKLDILINNAGTIVPGPFEESSYDDIEKQISINLMGVINCTHEAIPELKKNREANIVTISSLAGIVPETYSAIYSATKFALRGLGLTLNLELSKHNIFVSTIFPDSVDTPMLKFEAENGGSPLTFLSKPQAPSLVAKNVLRAITKKKIELYNPYSQGLVTKLILCFPWLIQKIWPLLERSAESKKEKFIADHITIS